MNWYEIRFKVIAEYPSCDYEVGEILHCKDEQVNLIAFYTKYPHLFKGLMWWEDREDKDRPQYIKLIMDYINHKKGDVFATVDNWHEPESEGRGFIHFALDINNHSAIRNYSSISPSHNGESVFIPATEKEYLNRQNKKAKATT